MQKKMIVTKTVAAAVAFSMAFSMAAGITADAAKKKPKLNKTSLSLETGETAKLKVKKNKNKISKVTWKSTDATVASVKKGLVTAEAAGKATIKAVFKVKGAKKKTTLKCKVTVTGAETPLSGAWENAANPTLTDDVKNLVKEFASQTDATKMTITPYALLATQVVAGIGYRVLCRVDLLADANGNKLNTSTFSIVQIYADLDGKLVKDSSKLLALMDNFASETVGMPAAVSGSGVVGGFEMFEDPAIPADRLASFEKYFVDKGFSNFPYKPIARLAHRGSTGNYEVSLVCSKELEESSGNIGIDEPVGYFVIKMTLDASQQHIATSPMIFPFTFMSTDYGVCISKDISAVKVETQAAWIRNYFIAAATGDMTALTELAGKVSYPVMIDGKEVKTQEELATLFATKKISADFLLAMRRATPMQIFTNAQGLMLGSGEYTVWLNQDTTDKTQIKITAVNGMFAK